MYSSSYCTFYIPTVVSSTGTPSSLMMLELWLDSDYEVTWAHDFATWKSSVVRILKHSATFFLEPCGFLLISIFSTIFRFATSNIFL